MVYMPVKRIPKRKFKTAVNYYEKLVFMAKHNVTSSHQSLEKLLYKSFQLHPEAAVKYLNFESEHLSEQNPIYRAIQFAAQKALKNPPPPSEW